MRFLGMPSRREVMARTADKQDIGSWERRSFMAERSVRPNHHAARARPDGSHLPLSNPTAGPGPTRRPPSIFKRPTPGLLQSIEIARRLKTIVQREDGACRASAGAGRHRPSARGRSRPHFRHVLRSVRPARSAFAPVLAAHDVIANDWATTPGAGWPRLLGRRWLITYLEHGYSPLTDASRPCWLACSARPTHSR